MGEEMAARHLVLGVSSQQHLRDKCQRGPGGQLEMRIELERIDWGVISLRMLMRASE